MDKTCCVTGHRNIPDAKIEYIKSELQREILQAIDDGYTHFISGFAQGVDLLFAAIVADMKNENPSLTLEAAIPYQNRIKASNKQFCHLLAKCDIVSIQKEEYTPECFMSRNRYMVLKSQRLIAVYDGRKKGRHFSQCVTPMRLKKKYEL